MRTRLDEVRCGGCAPPPVNVPGSVRKPTVEGGGGLRRCGATGGEVFEDPGRPGMEGVLQSCVGTATQQ
jgi:hypothetical protein